VTTVEPTPGAFTADEKAARHRPPPQEVTRAEALARRLDKPMGALGVVFLLVVLGQGVAEERWLVRGLAVLGWLLWGAFVAEFVLRAYVARSQRLFWRRNWWQVLFLALPFLRLVRALTFVRIARVSGVLSAAVRGSRSAGRLLSDRLSWLTVVTAVVTLASSQLLYTLDAYGSYATALHAAAMSTVTGAPLRAEGAVARVMEVALAVYSVAVCATLAAALGAYFIQGRPAQTPRGHEMQDHG
jgi:voltage-gated potassium channel